MLGLKPDEFGDRGTLTLWPIAAGDRLRMATNRCGLVAVGFALTGPSGGVAGAIQRLALGAGDRQITAGLATAWHDCTPLRDDIQAGGDTAFAGNWLAASLAPRVRAERRR